MKTPLLILFTSFFFTSCHSNKAGKIEEETTHVFDFLIGKWFRTNDENGKQTFENWKKLNDSTYIGHSYTLTGKDTIWQENTVLSPVGGTWYYQVKLQNEKTSTDFQVVEEGNSSFACENKQNEFPKTIRYWKSGENLQAEISDGKSKIEFFFEPIQ